jgi:hypothetical protein
MYFKNNIFKSGAMLIVSFLLFVNTSFSQPYQPFPDSNAVWTIGIYDVFGTFYSYYTYRIASINVDTIISSNSYQKVFYFDSSTSLYKGALRQTTGRKVFFVPKDSLNEKLLYDFSANIGDTVHNVYSDWSGSEPVHNEAILNVDSILIKGSYHKTLLLPLGFYWIEGIGSTGGLFESTYGGTFSTVYKLKCFMEYGIPALPDSTTNCLTLNIPETATPENAVSIFPNPSNGHMQLNLNLGTPQQLFFKIYNSIGECVYQTEIKNVTSSVIPIDKTDLPSGIYFYELRNNTTIKTDKIIIAK